MVRGTGNSNVEKVLANELTFRCEFCAAVFGNTKQLSGHRIGKHVRKLGLRNATITINHLKEAQKGYVAAFLDGEGGIQITKTSRPDRVYTLALHPTVYFCNTNHQVIQTLKLWLGTGSLVTRKERPGCKDRYVLHITGTRNIRELLQCVKPFMTVKVDQANLMLDYCESRLHHYRGGDRQFSETELELYTALVRLNRKGRMI